jgi:hypothetical protein
LAKQADDGDLLQAWRKAAVALQQQKAAQLGMLEIGRERQSRERQQEADANAGRANVGELRREMELLLAKIKAQVRRVHGKL